MAYTIYILSKTTYTMWYIYICSIYIYICIYYITVDIYVYINIYIYIDCTYSIYILHIYICIYIYTTHTLYITYSISILIIDTYAYICTIKTTYTMAWLLRKPPLPCHRGGNHLAGWGGCGGPCSYIYIYNMCCNHGPCDIRPKIDFLTSIQDFAMDKTLCAHCFGWLSVTFWYVWSPNCNSRSVNHRWSKMACWKSPI